jgi:hypothetical protein
MTTEIKTASGRIWIEQGLSDDPADNLFRLNYSGQNGIYPIPGVWKTQIGAEKAAQKIAAETREGNPAPSRNFK